MSEVLPSDSYFNYSPLNSERASVYIGDNMTEQDREAANIIAQSFAQADKPIAETAVLIPVAAHQDGELIIPTLAEYAHQKNAKPFTIFLHLNAPLDTGDMDKINEAERNVRVAQSLFPDLDVRFDTMLYDKPTIGQLRKNLWDAVFMLAHYEHGFSHDVIGINNDIDTLKISPHYISRIQQHYNRRLNQVKSIDAQHSNTILKPVATRVTHAVIPSHPNTGKVTTWIDNTYFQAPGHVAYEAGMVIPFSHYAYLVGFDEESKTHETSWVNNDGKLPYISAAQLYTSPRRYIDRIHENTTSAIWTEDSFGSNDICRETLKDDIDFERAEELILDRLQDDIENLWLPGALVPIYDDVATNVILGTDTDEYIRETVKRSTRLVERQLAKAERMLRKVIGSEALADIVNASIDPEAYSKAQFSSLHDLYRVLNDSGSDTTANLK